MAFFIIGFALFVIFAAVIGIAFAGASGLSSRRDYDSGPAFWNNNNESSRHTHNTFGSSASDSDAHRLHQQSDHSPSSHESQHSWGGDSGGSSAGSDGGGSSGGDSGSST
jgi:hypothetical protein